MPNSKTIGILAGMGPRSTAPFIDRVVSECQRQYGAKHDNDFAPMMIYSLPTPFYLDRPIDHSEMKHVICDGLRRLESTGVAFIAMPCNSAHIYFDELKDCVRVPLLNMIDEVLRALPGGARRMALLATRPTVESGLYQRGASHYGVEMVVREEWQAMVDSVIGQVKAGHIDSARSIWRGLLTKLAAADVGSAILACTDLNPASAGESGELALLDAMECLARATVQMWLELS